MAGHPVLDNCEILCDLLGMEPWRAIRKLYDDTDGYDIPATEAAAVSRSRGDPLYGELMPAGCRALIDALALGPGDVFYDLGSGVGKVVLQLAMSVPVKRCVGYELSATRCRLARSALLRARKMDLIRARTTVFRQLDILRAPLEDATVVYTCSTAFSDEFMRALMRRLIRHPRPLTFVTLSELDEHSAFHLERSIQVRTNWNPRARAYIYRVEILRH